MKKFKPSLIYLWAIILLMYLPVITVIIFSFNASKLSTIWSGFSIEWYVRLFHNNAMMDALKNSVILALLSCGLSAVVGTAGAYGIVRAKIPGKSFFESVSLIPIMIPEIILGMTFMAFFSILGLKFGMLTLVIGHSAFCIPYIFMMVKGALISMDPLLEDSARDLGASGIRAFIDITLPQIFPSIISGTLLAFAMSLDDVVISFFVTGAKVNTLPVKIYSQLKTGVTPEVNALCTIMLAVTFLIIFVSTYMRKRK